MQGLETVLVPLAPDVLEVNVKEVLQSRALHLNHHTLTTLQRGKVHLHNTTQHSKHNMVHTEHVTPQLITF
jgi:hypothetical protein